MARATRNQLDQPVGWTRVNVVVLRQLDRTHRDFHRRHSTELSSCASKTKVAGSKPATLSLNSCDDESVSDAASARDDDRDLLTDEDLRVRPEHVHCHGVRARVEVRIRDLSDVWFRKLGSVA